MTPGVAGPRSRGTDVPTLWAPGPALAEPSETGRLRGRFREEPGVLERGCGGRSGTLRVRSPGPAEPLWSPRGGLWKGWRRPKELTVPQLICAALKLARTLSDHVWHQQPRGCEEAAGEYAERLAGLVTGVQEEIPTCQGGC